MRDTDKEEDAASAAGGEEAKEDIQPAGASIRAEVGEAVKAGCLDKELASDNETAGIEGEAEVVLSAVPKRSRNS